MDRQLLSQIGNKHENTHTHTHTHTHTKKIMHRQEEICCYWGTLLWIKKSVTSPTQACLGMKTQISPPERMLFMCSVVDAHTLKFIFSECKNQSHHSHVVQEEVRLCWKTSLLYLKFRLCFQGDSALDIIISFHPPSQKNSWILLRYFLIHGAPVPLLSLEDI